MIPSEHPDQPGLIQQLPERRPCDRCGCRTCNEVDGVARCLWHHGQAKMTEKA